MKLALELVSSLERADGEMKKIYGGLCHNFPVFVMQSGLCQAVAFSADKGKTEPGKEPTPRASAHQTLLRHVGKILEIEGDYKAVLAAIQKLDTVGYMHQTRRVLDSWVYFKRFAVSVLKVKAGEQDEG